MNISENELIARWMGIKEEKDFYDSYGKDEPYYFTRNEIYRTYSRTEPGLSFGDFVQNSRYHCEWDWLMPVVEKIKSLKYRVEIHLHYIQLRCEIYGIDFDTKINSGFEVEKDSPLILHVYKAVVSFIKWYENQK